jgi:pimeloyl-ACP methyl ester carboxylesterase
MLRNDAPFATHPRASWRSALQWLAALLLTALIAVGSAAWWLGGQQFAPNLHPVGAPPVELGARAVSFTSLSGRPVSGWLIPGTGAAAVLLLHGSGGERRSLMGRARFLHEAGYTVLSIDLQGSGESPGTHETLGFLESLDAQAAVTYLRTALGARRVGLIGFSLGGAAALLGPQGPVAADALVLEAVYPTIEEALANRIRLRLGPWSGWLYPFFTWQIRPRLGLAPADLRPIERIGAVTVPVFVIGGRADRHTTPAETRRLYAAAPEPKRLWLVPGAVHGDLYAAAPLEYQRRVLAFLAAALGPRDQQ